MQRAVPAVDRIAQGDDAGALAQAFDYAVARGARIVLAGWATRQRSRALEDAVIADFRKQIADIERDFEEEAEAESQRYDALGDDDESVE